MSLEQQIAALVAATNQLTGEVSGKMAQIDQRVEQKRGELEAWKNGARNEYPAVNLLPNSRFLTDADSDGNPDGYWSFYARTAAPPTKALITPNINAIDGSDEKIAALLTQFATPTRELLNRVMKLSFAASAATDTSGIFSLNQAIPLPTTRLVSRGIYVYAKTAGAANIVVGDAPGNGSISLNNTDFNKPAKLATYGGVDGSQLGFLFLVGDVTAPLDLYVALPWFATGYVDSYPPSIEGR